LVQSLDFTSLLTELVHKVRHLHKKGTEVQEIVSSYVDTFTSAQVVYQLADRLVTLVMYDKDCDEVEEQVVELMMQCVQTLEIMKREKD